MKTKYFVVSGWCNEDSVGPFTLREAAAKKLEMSKTWHRGKHCWPEVHNPDNYDLGCSTGLTRAEQDELDEIEFKLMEKK